MRLENYSVAAFEDVGVLADEPVADAAPSTVEAAPLPETPSTLLSEMAQQPPVFTRTPPPAPITAEVVSVVDASVADAQVKPLASAAESPTPAAPTWQGMNLPSAAPSSAGAAPSPWPGISAEAFARMEAASSQNSGGGRGSSFGGGFSFGGGDFGGGGDVESWDYSFEGIDGAPDVNISVTYQGETPISSQTTTTLADSGAGVSSMPQQLITVPAPVDTSGISAELPSWSDSTPAATDSAGGESNGAGAWGAADGGVAGSAPLGGTAAAAVDAAAPSANPVGNAQQAPVVGTNGSGQDIRAVGSYQPLGAIRVVDDAPVLRAGDPNIVGDATGATPMRDEAGTLLYRIDGGKDNGVVRQLLPAGTSNAAPESIPAVDAMGNITGHEQSLDTGESSPDPVLIQQMAGGLTGAVRSIAKGADAAVRVAGNTVIQIGDILTRGVNHDDPFIQQAWIEQGALAHGAVRLVTEPSAVWDDVKAGFTARSDAAGRLRAQGRHFDAAVIDGEMAADVSQVVIGAAGVARATVRGGAAVLESLGAEGNGASRARVPVADGNLADADLPNVYERQTQTRLPAELEPDPVQAPAPAAGPAAVDVPPAELTKSGIGAVQELESVQPTASGTISANKLNSWSYSLTDLTVEEQAMARNIAANGDAGGELTEQLVNKIAERQGWEALEGGKYGSNNGFDHVLVHPDGSVTLLLDSKQMVNGTATLDPKAAGGNLQMSDKWVDKVLDTLERMDPNSPAAAAIREAQMNGTLVKGVIGVDRTTGQVTVIRVKG